MQESAYAAFISADALSDLANWLAVRPALHSFLMFAVLAPLAWLANRIARMLLSRVLRRLQGGPQGTVLSNDLYMQPLMHVLARVANIMPAIVFFFGVGLMASIPPILVTVVQNTAQAAMVVTLALALGGLLDLAEVCHRARSGARYRPIKGYLQLGKITIYALGTVLVVAILVDRSPVILLSGIGAMAAVLMLIFQDTLLSMVASVQINSSGILRVGDWIEMPQLNADGAVIDIALHTVKVQNWDLTITTIPTKRLISDAFKNWRGMQESGGRRIKRALFLDQNSVRFLDAQAMRRLQEFSLLSDYLGDKQRELATWNARSAQNGHSALDSRKVSNLGTFRKYVEHYLRSHASIRKDMTLMVRQLSPTAEGLPLEIYCFSNTVAWAEYENIQADIFDHLLAVIDQFELRVFQRPGGADMHPLRAISEAAHCQERNRTPAY